LLSLRCNILSLHILYYSNIFSEIILKMSEVDDRFVKRGLWTNWSQGPIMGKTITTDARTGTILIAMLAVLVTAAGSQLWNLLTFFYHQKRAARATNIPSDGLFWQQQALLRTLPSPISFAVDMVKLSFVWRKKSRALLIRCVGPAMLAILFGAATIASGIFSSLVVTTTGLEVLVDNASRLFERPLVGATLWTSRIVVLGSYTRLCYQNSTSLSALCRNTYISPAIKFEPVIVECPWNTSLCLSPAISMDSGYLDVNAGLGLNLKPSDKVRFRRKTTCNVLPMEGHIITRNASDYADMPSLTLFPGDRVMAVRYGERFNTLHAEDTFYASEFLMNQTTGYGLK
jgi:hypothetical protein